MMAQRAWNILNDWYTSHFPFHSSQQLPLCLQYKSNAIACAAIYLAAMTLEIPLPAMEWWELFDCTAEEIQAITQQIIRLYQREKIVWLPDLGSAQGIQFNFASYEEVFVGSPDRVRLLQPCVVCSANDSRVKVKADPKVESKPLVKQPDETPEPSRERQHSHHRSRSRSHHRRDRSHHRSSHSHRRSRSHDREHHSHRRHHHH